MGWGQGWKISIWGFTEKPIYRGELPEKGGLGQFADLRGACRRRGGSCFWGGVDTPVYATYLQY